MKRLNKQTQFTMKNPFKRPQQTIEQARNKRVSDLFSLLKTDIETSIFDNQLEFSPDDEVIIANQFVEKLRSTLINQFSDCHTEIERLKIKAENIDEAIAKLK